jgi:hypothetical protein
LHTATQHVDGRLVTDEDFRTAFRHDPRAALVNVAGWGLELSAGEVGALLDTDHTLWDRVARELYSRLQEASLRAPAAWLLDLETAVTAGPQGRTRPTDAEVETTNNEGSGQWRSA